ncbi:hypothetical protein GCM10020000_54540 [Streptomyces olivoverticillatus]
MAPATGSEAVAEKPSPYGCRRSSDRIASSWAASAVPVRVQPGRDLLARLQALVGAEAADLGDDLLDGGDLLLGRRVAEAARGVSPRNEHSG